MRSRWQQARIVSALGAVDDVSARLRADDHRWTRRVRAPRTKGLSRDRRAHAIHDLNAFSARAGWR
jgi:hypothetical protein